jgi:hypothetical protein
MENQTPISQLGNIGAPDNNIDNTVDDIINRINGDDTEHLQMQQPTQQPNYEPVQHVEPTPIIQQPSQQMVPPQAPPYQDNEVIDTSGFDTNVSSLTDNIIKSSKHPLIIMVLYILLNLKQVDNIFKYKTISLLVGEEGQLTFTCVIIKAIILGLLFYVIKLFV